jgi:hypothetical protein
VFRRRRRVVLLSVVVVLLAGIGVFADLWSSSGAHEVPLSQAISRFHTSTTTGDKGPASRPAQGVYRYTGGGSEHISFPPKTQSEGPLIPGTVTWIAGGCWEIRYDYSNHHWQSATYCPGTSGLVLTGRAGWYLWDLVFTSVGATATYTCEPPEVALPRAVRSGQRFTFACRGTNQGLPTPPVTMAGYDEVVGTGSTVIGGTRLATVHMREVATFSGGQTGSNLADTWLDAANGLPVSGTWSTTVHTASPIGASTLTAHGDFRLTSLTAAA